MIRALEEWETAAREFVANCEKVGANPERVSGVQGRMFRAGMQLAAASHELLKHCAPSASASPATMKEWLETVRVELVEVSAERDKLRAELDTLRGIYEAQCQETIAARAESDELRAKLLSAPSPRYRDTFHGNLDCDFVPEYADQYYGIWYQATVAPLREGK